MNIMKKIIRFFTRPRRMEEVVPACRKERDVVLAKWSTVEELESYIATTQKRADSLYAFVREHAAAIANAATDEERVKALSQYGHKINDLTMEMDIVAELSVHLSLWRNEYGGKGTQEKS